MKKTLILFLLCVFITAKTLHAQNNEDDEPVYYYTKMIPIGMIQCSLSGQTVNSREVAAPYNSRFYFVGNKGDSVIITFFFFTTNEENYLKYNTTVEKNDIGRFKNTNGTFKILNAEDRKYFLISKMSFEKHCYPYYSTKFKNSTRFTLSAVTLPVKLRLKNFDFANNFSLGIAAGIKWRISNYSKNYINLLGAINISTNDLDSFSTKGKVLGQPIKNIGTFSPGLGFVLEFNKAQIGFFCGIDLMSKANRVQYGWIYNGKPWLSVGFGFSILGKESEPKEQTKVTETN